MKKPALFTLLILSLQLLAAQDLADLFEKHKRSVVTIFVAEQQNTGMGDPRTFASSMGLGSGVLINDNIILTAAHVVANAEAIMVQMFDGEKIPAKTERISRIADVAVIRLEKTPMDPHVASLGDSDQTRIGEEVFIIGAPMSLPNSLSRGVISGRRYEEKLTGLGKQLEFFQTDAAINTGNSGGPMFNYKGEVIGIVSSILSRSGGFEGIGFAATTNICKDLLMARSSKYFGIEAIVLPFEMARILNVPQEGGWLIQHVTQESPAGKLGLRGGYLRANIMEQDIMLGGDIILQVDNIEISGHESFEMLARYMDGIEGAHKYQLKVLRGGEIMDFYWISSSFGPN